MTGEAWVFAVGLCMTLALLMVVLLGASSGHAALTSVLARKEQRIRDLELEVSRLRRQLIRPVDSPAVVVADSLQARLERERHGGMARTRAEIQALPEIGGDAS